MTNNQGVIKFETSKFYSLDDLILFGLSWVFGTMIFSNSLQSVVINGVYVFVFLGLFFGVLYLRKQFIFKDFFKSSLSYNPTTKVLQIDDQKIPRKDIQTVKVWTVRGIDRCLDVVLKDQTKIRVLTPQAKKLAELIG